MKRTILEAIGGLVIGMPIGILLYYSVTLIYAFLFQIGIGFLLSIVKEPGPQWQDLFQQLDFGPIVVILLASIAMIGECLLMRVLLRSGYRVFAWGQLVPALAASLFLFSLSLIHHKPLLPFWEQ